MRGDNGRTDAARGDAPAAPVGEHLSEEQRRRLAPPSPLHAEVDRIADQLGASVTGDFGFNVESESEDFTVQKLVVMTNFLLDTIRRALADLEQRSRDLEEQLTTIRSQQATIAELANPVLRVWEGVLVLPLVGVLTAERTALATARLLDRVAAEGARAVILDVTGAPEIDGRAAGELLRMVGAVGLLGARCVLSGVQPAVAQALVGEGLEIQNAEVRRDLGEALRACLAVGAVEVPGGPRAARRRA